MICFFPSFHRCFYAGMQSPVDPKPIKAEPVFCSIGCYCHGLLSKSLDVFQVLISFVPSTQLSCFPYES